MKLTFLSNRRTRATSKSVLLLSLATAAASAAVACASDGETLVEDPNLANEANGGNPGEDSRPEISGVACAQAARIGSFTLDLASDYTSFRGAVSDGVAPSSILNVAQSEATCQLFEARNLFCSSPCPSGNVCAGDDVCVPTPMKRSVGEVSVTGLVEDLKIKPNGITVDYSSTFSDPYPGFTTGANILVVARGDELDGVTLVGEGVSPLTSAVESVLVERESPAALSWDPPSVSSENAEIHVLLTVNSHGATSGWIECTAPDTGAFEIPASLVTALIDLGLSGFPRVTLTRRTIDSRNTGDGCIEFSVASALTINVEVPGLVSCSDADDCAAGFVCSAELLCEEE